MRYFNTSGPNIIEEHYTLMRSKLIEEGLDKIHKNHGIVNDGILIFSKAVLS